MAVPGRESAARDFVSSGSRRCLFELGYRPEMKESRQGISLGTSVMRSLDVAPPI